MKNANVIVAKNIRQMRHALNLTQAQLADRMGYSVKASSKWENTCCHSLHHWFLMLLKRRPCAR